MKYKMSFFLCVVFCFTNMTAAGATETVFPLSDPPKYYRELTQKIRAASSYKIFLPAGQALSFSHNFELGEAKTPLFELPIVSDLHIFFENPKKFLRNVMDRIYTAGDSNITFGDELLPLTCVVVDMNDNRYSKDNTPLQPDYMMKVTLVANDFTCTGPMNPNFPQSSTKPETWDSYIQYKITDPTIMLTQDIKLRYRWNEYNAVLFDTGAQP